MPLTNRQYDLIFHEYEERQTRTRHRQLARIKEIYAKIPEYEEVESSISSVSVAQAKKLLDGDGQALEDLKTSLQILSRKKAELLQSHGFPADYLKPQYECEICKDTGYINNQKCTCLKQRIISFLYEQSNIKEILKKENFSVLSDTYYEGEDLQRFLIAVKTCKAFTQNFSREFRNLFFYGSVGAGKTFLSNCVAKECIEQGCLVIYFSAANLIENLSSKDKDGLFNICQDIYDCDLLIIDDLGTEFTNTYVISQLFSCLNERILRRKSTLISTNLSLQDLRNRYSERIFSRITSNYDMLKITGPDIRMCRKKTSNRK